MGSAATDFQICSTPVLYTICVQPILKMKSRRANGITQKLSPTAQKLSIGKMGKRLWSTNDGMLNGIRWSETPNLNVNHLSGMLQNGISAVSIMEIWSNSETSEYWKSRTSAADRTCRSTGRLLRPVLLSASPHAVIQRQHLFPIDQPPINPT